MFTPSPYRVIRAGESFRMLGNGISAAAALVTSEENPSASATAADPRSPLASIRKVGAVNLAHCSHSLSRVVRWIVVGTAEIRGGRHEVHGEVEHSGRQVVAYSEAVVANDATAASGWR